MMRSDLLRSMLRALSDVKENGDTYEMSDGWDVTVHAGRKGASFTVQQVIRVSLKPEFVLIETRKGNRHVIVDEEVSAFGQEPSERDSKTSRRAGFHGV
jgi:hypothetical protein